MSSLVVYCLTVTEYCQCTDTCPFWLLTECFAVRPSPGGRGGDTGNKTGLASRQAGHAGYRLGPGAGLRGRHRNLHVGVTDLGTPPARLLDAKSNPCPRSHQQVAPGRKSGPRALPRTQAGVNPRTVSISSRNIPKPSYYFAPSLNSAQTDGEAVSLALGGILARPWARQRRTPLAQAALERNRG